MTDLMSDPLEDLAAVLRATVDGVAAEFGGAAQVVTDERQGTDLDPPAEMFVRTYLVSIPMAPDAHATLTGTIVPRLAAEGWQVTARDTDREFAVHFGRDGFDIGVMVGRLDGASIVVGGSTPAVVIPRPDDLR